ncbi:MAG TPA: 16S rRNA (guanine(527)-N(7))-methyltransferase RsmG [Casimicrobiaceae bacterium]|nr:16S rRNA (guanine(527)-N(7))-methyltransferase RsmG [Casimicrobiaceae bacterium]
MTSADAVSTHDVDLANGIAALGLVTSVAQRDRLAAYLALLAKWNKTYNLTAIRDPARMVTHHLLDSLAVVPHLPATPALRILDVGSGAGVPGIPLATARPDAHVVMIDSNHKKVAFLTQAAIELGLTNVESEAVRVEDYAPAAPFDIVISRAFSDLSAFAASSARHLARDGMLYAMKGVHPDDELAQLPAQFAVRAAPALHVPGLDATRHLIIMQPLHAAERA